MPEPVGPVSQHLTPAQVGRWVEVSLTTPERNDLADHLADCDSCRSEVVAARRILRKVRGRRRGRLLLAFGAGMAALLVLGVPRSMLEQADTLRVTATEGDIRIEVERPVDGSSVSGSSVSFEWRPPGDEVGYRITVTTELGALVWEESTPDVRVALPDSVVPLPAGRYYWWVDALLEGGETATSGIMEFVVPP